MTYSSFYPSDARIRGSSVSIKHEDGSHTLRGSVSRLPIKQCVWLVECVLCQFEGYADHKPEATQVLFDHHSAQHTELEEES